MLTFFFAHACNKSQLKYKLLQQNSYKLITSQHVQWSKPHKPLYNITTQLHFCLFWVGHDESTDLRLLNKSRTCPADSVSSVMHNDTIRYKLSKSSF